MDKRIEKIEAKEILDSRGKPTLEVSVYAGGMTGTFSVPSGRSKGSHEMVSIDVQKAIASVAHLNDTLKGFSLDDQESLDSKLIALDGTKDKSKLGGNALLGVSVAYAKVGAKLSGKEIFEYLQEIAGIESFNKIPRLYINLVNGGEHSRSPLVFQEYHVVPETENIREALEQASRIQSKLQELVEKEFGVIILGDEGGFVLNTSSVEKPLELLAQAIKNSDLEGKIKLSLDVAASSFFKNGKYVIGNKEYEKEELINLYKNLVSKYGIFSIEDPLQEEDFEGFAEFRKETKISAVGDDLTVTNPERVNNAIEKKSIDAVIIKPNQIGTLTETLEAMRVARENGVDCIVSHRSGETEDTFIADLAWAFGCLGLKAGAPNQEVRKVKYERLCQIQEHK
ncbi:MAG: enolase C-terminal domain-like protein [Patescibacteria group bacterium]